MNLLKMVDFILKVEIEDTIDKDAADIYRNYARFLTQFIKLEMFVPCDEYGVFMKEPSNYYGWKYYNERSEMFDYSDCEAYEKAQDKILFKGFKYVEKRGSFSHVFRLNNSAEFTVSFLNNEVQYFEGWDIKLSDTAIKQIFFSTI